jgi:hypothetical protein
MADQRDFYVSLPIFSDFAEVVRAESFSPLPDEWFVGFTDVTGSTAAIAAGRYKAVNMVGAGAIAAVANSLGRRRGELSRLRRGCARHVGRAGGHGVVRPRRVQARSARRDDSSQRDPRLRERRSRRALRGLRALRYAMFSGGGLTWFEAQAKNGRYALPLPLPLPLAPPDARPDLSGLSCLWGVAPARNGVVLSVILAPRSDDPRFASLVGEIVKMALEGSASERPVTVNASWYSGAPESD